MTITNKKTGKTLEPFQLIRDYRRLWLEEMESGRMFEQVLNAGKAGGEESRPAKPRVDPPAPPTEDT